MLIRYASWIRMKDADSLTVPVFRKIFACRGRVKAANLEVTCDGVYEAQLNVSRVGDFILAPGCARAAARLMVLNGASLLPSLSSEEAGFEQST